MIKIKNENNNINDIKRNIVRRAYVLSILLIQKRVRGMKEYNIGSIYLENSTIILSL